MMLKKAKAGFIFDIMNLAGNIGKYVTEKRKEHARYRLLRHKAWIFALLSNSVFIFRFIAIIRTYRYIWVKNLISNEYKFA